MSASDSDTSDDDSSLTFEPLQKELENMLEELNGTIAIMEKVKKEVCQPHNLFEDLHLKNALHEYLANWKAEGRLSPSGSSVRLTEVEAHSLQIPFTEETTNIYEICCALVGKILCC